MNSCVPKVLGSMTPPQLGLSVAGRSRQRADAIAPVIFVGEASARPAHVGHAKLFQRRNHVIANAACLGIGESGPTQTPS